jgi:hypothetical protein
LGLVLVGSDAVGDGSKQDEATPQANLAENHGGKKQHNPATGNKRDAQTKNAASPKGSGVLFDRDT